MSKLLDWLIKEPKTATTQELEMQAENAAQALEAAREAAGEADEAFDADPGKENAALKAREAVTRAELHLERARRLLEARKRDEAEQERADVETQLKELDKQMQTARNKARELPDVTAHALLKVAEAYAQQLATNEELSTLEHKYAQLAHGLGDRGEFHEIHQSLTSGRPRPYWHVIVRLLEDEMKNLETNSHTYRAAEEITRSMRK